jgi:hypothetical protein
LEWNQSKNISKSNINFLFLIYWSIITVADGVGGWRKHGVDPSGYSRGLCEK